MLAGILMSVKEPSGDVTEIVSDFGSEGVYDPGGYASTDPFDEDNANDFGRFNGKVGDFISKGINSGIEAMFDIIKKIIS